MSKSLNETNSFPGYIIYKISKSLVWRAAVLVSSVASRLKRPSECSAESQSNEIQETSITINDQLNLGNKEGNYEYVLSKCGSLFISRTIRVRLARCSARRFLWAKGHALECLKERSSFAVYFRTWITNEIDYLFLWLGRERCKRNVRNQRRKGKCDIP